MNRTNAQNIHLPGRSPYRKRNQLIGKVVLLIGNDTAVLQTLITQLAQKGADVALFCRQLPAKQARSIQAQVESFGQRFLLLTENRLHPLPPDRVNPVEWIVQTVVSALGRLDIFIDLSAQQERAAAPASQPQPGAVQPSWQIRQAILAELAHV
ncbi:MAG: hypothetical protein R3D55_14540 [Chloroflexota bacterium]